MSNYNKEKIIGYIIGINPTGKLDYNGTYNMTGNNNTIQNIETASKSNLKKVNNNEIICNQIENFENLNTYNKYYNIYFIFLFILCILFYLFYLFYFKY
jgi:hypothetical protein